MKFPVISVLFLVLVTSCAPAPYLFRSSVTRDEIPGFRAFSTIADVGVIHREDEIDWNDSLSGRAAWIIDSLLSVQPQITVAGDTFFIDDADLRAQVADEMEALNTKFDNKKTRSVPIPAGIQELMDMTEERFGLFIVMWGYTRTKENYKERTGGWLMKAIVSGIIASLFGEEPDDEEEVPRYYSEIKFVIADNDRKEIAFYHGLGGELRPTTVEGLETLVSRFAADYASY